MRTRVIVGSILIVCIAALCLADHYFLRASRPLGTLLITALALGGWFELGRMTGMRGGSSPDRPLFVLGLLLVLYFHALAWWTSAEGIDPALVPSHAEATLWGVFVLVFGSFALVVTRADFHKRHRALLETVVGVLLLGVLVSAHVRIYLRDEGVVLALIYLAGIKGTDIAAYFIGSRLGRHRFLKVSPKKTVEGCLAGLLWGALWFTFWAWLRPDLLFPWPQGIVFGIILAIVAQVGDLSVSLFKRVYEVKDSGTLLPEFGGVLDLIDSLIFSGWVFFLALKSS